MENLKVEILQYAGPKLKSLSANRKLNAVLKYLNKLNNEKRDIKISFVRVPEVDWDVRSRIEIALAISFGRRVEFISEMDLILDYLKTHEQMIDEIPVKNEKDRKYYRISYKGKVFIENGGFVWKRRKDVINYTIKAVAAFLIFVATIGLAILELQKYHADCLCK